ARRPAARKRQRQRTTAGREASWTPSWDRGWRDYRTVGPRRDGRAWIGTSGYDYPHWRETFYPRELARKRWLDYAVRHFNSIELNGTFYSLKNPAVFQRWVEGTPARGFVF